jgi:hypothetical protein
MGQYPTMNKMTRAHNVGRSLAFTLNQEYARILGITNETYLLQKMVPGGLMLEIYHLAPGGNSEIKTESSSTATMTTKPNEQKIGKTGNNNDKTTDPRQHRK